MADIIDARENIDQELAKFESALSEAFYFLLGGSINFINNRQYDTHSFFLNGVYEKGAGQTGIDGLYVLQNDIEIVGISVGNLVPGLSGSTVLDIHLIDGGGVDQGTIFGTKPAISTAAVANAYAAENFINATTQASAGITLPTIPVKNYDAFDAFRIDIDTAMIGAENAFINIHFRPR